MTRSVVAGLLVLGLLAGCAQTAEPSAPASSANADQPVSSDMVQPVGGDLREGTAWYLLGASVSSVQMPSGVTLTFQDGSAGGHAPVNTYSADYTATDSGGLELGAITATLMAGSAEAMAAESAYFALLDTVDGYTTVDGGELYLFDGQMQVLTFATTPGPENPLAVSGVALELAASVIGRTEAEAQRTVEDAGYTYRVIARDDTVLEATDDYSVTRVNVAVRDGVVTEATIG